MKPAIVAAFVAVALGAIAPAVFVTPYLPDRADQARELTSVHLDGWNHPNYAGFITIDEASSSNMFFWFHEALNGDQNAPVLLWLQGGPGASSLFGMFTEIGPFDADSKTGKVIPRAVNWAQNYHLLFIDNPLGAGFSFTNDANWFVSNQTQVGANLYATLQQFFQLFPQYRANPFYVTGESYAGKYVPACAYTIHTRNQNAAPPARINLQGIAIGDGAMDPGTQFLGFGELLYYLGMVDQNERLQFGAYEQEMQNRLARGDLLGAFEVFDVMLNGDITPYPTYYANVTGMKSNYFNFQQSPDGSSLTSNQFIDWLATDAARSAAHVGDIPYNVANITVEYYLLEDWMRGVVPFLVPLMENYKVLIYNGQNDVILGPPLTENFLRNLKWSGQQEYLAAVKHLWQVGSGRTQDLAGYARVVGKFVQVVVRGAGHMVPGDQPTRAYDLITRFVDGTPFSE